MALLTSTQSNNQTVSKGVFAVSATLGGIGISLSQLESWLRITSLAVGITAGLLTVVSLGMNLWKQLRK